MGHGSRRNQLIRSIRRRATGDSGAIRHAGILLPPPELRPGGEHFQDDDAFLASGRAEARRLHEAFATDADSRLLDVGCGVGRLPIGLLAEFGPMREYVGIDVSERAIRWCRRYIELRHPTMRFRCLNVYNERYRPAGRKIDGAFSFPLAPSSVDTVYLYSVFSHMRGLEIERYLREFSRVLVPNGTVFLTAFIEDSVDHETVNPAGYQRGWDGPLHCVRFDRVYFEDVVARSGFRVTHLDRHAETDGQSGVYLNRV